MKKKITKQEKRRRKGVEAAPCEGDDSEKINKGKRGRAEAGSRIFINLPRIVNHVENRYTRGCGILA